MLRHVALDEEGADVGIEPARDEQRGQVEGRLAQLGGVLGEERDRVQVDDHVVRVVLVLLLRPAADRPDVVAEMLHTGGLNA